jgi:hypothetical protein
MVSLSAAGVGAIALVVSLILMKMKASKSLVPWLMLIAGFGVIGLVGRVIDRVAQGATRGTISASEGLLGIGVPALLAIGMSIVLYLQMTPKGPSPTRVTPWLALVFPSVLYAAGGLFANVAAFGETTFGDLGTAALATLADLAQGL